eukprot:m.265998 g.265998  ORF g.265998 m.265998 type:complete len:578 (+) comp16238_c0_seq31:160-1893(+)
MGKFVPVVDNETPRCERDDNSEAMRKHRQFDNPFQVKHKRQGAGANTARNNDRAWDRGKGWDRSGGQTSWQSYREQTVGSRHDRKRQKRDYGLDTGGPDHRSEEYKKYSTPAVSKTDEATMAEPTERSGSLPEDPSGSLDDGEGWEPHAASSWMFNKKLDLYFDPSTNTYFKFDSEANEFVVVEPETTEEDTTEQRSCIPELKSGSESWTGRKETNEDRVSDEDLGVLGRYFGLYDGHGGTECADYLVRHLHKNLVHSFKQERVEYECPQELSSGSAMESLIQNLQQQCECISEKKKLNGISDEVAGETKTTMEELFDLVQKEVAKATESVETARRKNLKFEKAVSESMSRAFEVTDKSFLSGAREKKIQSGSTAVAALVHGTAPDDVRVTVANTGDSRAVLCRNGKAVDMSEDHKPSLPSESKRIKQLGGVIQDVVGVHRVSTSNPGTPWMSVARAFGDISLKEPKKVMICTPELQTRHILPGDELIVLGCDGIWDVLSSQDAVDIALEHKGSPRTAASAIVRAAHKKGSEDNITATVVEFPWARPPLPAVPEDEEPEEEQDEVNEAVDADLDMFA